MHCNNILIQKSQQDAPVTEFILSDDCSTCFGYHYHPSSGAQNNCCKLLPKDGTSVPKHVGVDRDHKVLETE